MLDLHLLPGDYAVLRLPKGAALPLSLREAAEGLRSITWTSKETSVMCPVGQVPVGTVVETLWRCLRVDPVQLAQVGVLADLVCPLAQARVNAYVFSTFGNDYLLVPAVHLENAVSVLESAGHRIANSAG